MYLEKVLNCAAYPDDVVVYSDIWEQHPKLEQLEFRCLSESSLVLNLEFPKEVVYLPC